ncbi:YolD-like family protein [Oceanobacillus sp. 1P07AA]|uniref:YolD-like family protein n=1 Tax=Oceanobacillus sp. 1P07AA TaxID=3132293 RepID=UPI0039A56A43
MGSGNDRGSIKWTAMMMPEHIEMLKDLKKEQLKVQRPIIDQQKQEVINFQLRMGLKDNLLVEVKFYENGHFLTFKGYIQKMNYEKKSIEVSEGICAREFMRIKYEDILDVFIV